MDYSIIEDQKTGRRGKVFFIKTPKTYQLGDEIETDIKSRAYSISMREGGFLNIRYSTLDQWDDYSYSTVLDCFGGTEFPPIKGTNSYYDTSIS